jgi:hypothetical protein
VIKKLSVCLFILQKMRGARKVKATAVNDVTFESIFTLVSGKEGA